MNITAISGWALPAEWFHGQIEKYFPDAKINVLYPSDPGDTQEAERLLSYTRADIYLGYSLGSLWLMTHRKLLPPASTKVVLAPILAFTCERDRGGKTPTTKLKYLMRQLKRNPDDPSPLREFYLNCGIQVSDAWQNKIPENGILLKGLEFLQTAPVPDINGLEAIALVGEEDNLLDLEKLKIHLPQLEIIPDAGHAPELLLHRLAEILKLAPNG